MVFQLDSKGANALPGPLAGPASPLVARLSFELGLALACVRASDALRCVPARRVLKLSRINGFHPYDRLHAQQFLLVGVFGKKGKFMGFTKQVHKKGDFAVITRTSEQRAICTTRAPCFASLALSFDSA